MIIYLEFSYKYRFLVGYILPIELKRNIWEHYIKSHSLDIIKKFLVKNIMKCEQCNKNRLKYSLLKINACADSIYGYGGKCCYKLLCKRGCDFNLKCGHILKVEAYDQPTNKLDLECIKCGSKENKKLLWWGISCDEWIKKYF